MGDPHERHADEVASLVVQGRSAEGLLDEVAGPATAGVAGHRNVASGVQKKARPTPRKRISLGSSIRFLSTTPTSRDPWTRQLARYATSSSAALALLLVELGCSSSPTSSPPETRTKPSIERPGELAERTLRADAPFDLAFPSQVPSRRDVATNALLTACRAGHHPSCWLLLHLATTESALESRVCIATVNRA